MIGLPPCFSKQSMMAVTTGPELAGGSRAGSGTVWLQIVAGRASAGPLGAGACTAGFTPWPAEDGTAWSAKAAWLAEAGPIWSAKAGVGDAAAKATTSTAGTCISRRIIRTDIGHRTTQEHEPQSHRKTRMHTDKATENTAHRIRERR